MSDFYHTSPSEFNVGDRVQLHPATDAWMRGDRYGTVFSCSTTRVHVELDKSRRVVRYLPSMLALISDVVMKQLADDDASFADLTERLWHYVQRNDMQRREVVEMLAMEIAPQQLQQLLTNLEAEETASE